MAFNPGPPTPEEAMKALARSRNVKVKYEGKGSDMWGEDFEEFLAWTPKKGEPDETYVVTMKHNANGGFCKHIVACSRYWVGDWILKAAEGVAELQEVAHEDGKLARKAARMIEHRDNKIKDLQEQTKKLVPERGLL